MRSTNGVGATCGGARGRPPSRPRAGCSPAGGRSGRGWSLGRRPWAGFGLRVRRPGVDSPTAKTPASLMGASSIRGEDASHADQLPDLRRPVGRWSARNRKKAIAGWLAFVVVSLAIGSAVGMQEPESEWRIGDSGRAQKIIDTASPPRPTRPCSCRAAPRTARARRGPRRRGRRDRDGQARHARRRRRVAVQPPATRARSARTGAPSSCLRHQGRGQGHRGVRRADLRAIAAVAARHPDVSVGQFGGASATSRAEQVLRGRLQEGRDDVAADDAGDPLLRLRRALRRRRAAPARPLGRRGDARPGRPGSQLIPMDDTICSIILLVGMAVGVDYTLFYLRREREERPTAAASEEAIDIAAATSGRAVLVSGLTVMVAMAGMLLAGDDTFSALGIARSGRRRGDDRLGHRRPGRPVRSSGRASARGGSAVPGASRRRRVDGESGGWDAVLGAVMRRPASCPPSRRSRCWPCWPSRRCRCTPRTPARTTSRASSRS